tara:strand:+ start:1668 stop:1850 length:183 start_codon:yes stop_codon:yes gene_type:complete
MKRGEQKKRLVDTPVFEKPENEDYDPECALLVRKWFGEVLSSDEELILERYRFRCRFGLQ